jgi:hypothetical protein
MGATAAMAAMLAGTGLNAYGQYQAGQEEAGKAKQNAMLAEFQADEALSRGFLESARHQASVRRLTSTQRAGYASQGIDVFSGSATDVRDSAKSLGEVDAMMIRNNAVREAFGYRVQATSARDEAASARRRGTYGTIGTLLTGGAQAYSAGKSVT